MSNELTEYDREVLSRMLRGIYLLKSDMGEGLSNAGYAITDSLKSGTVDRLVELGLVYRSVNHVVNQRFLLTDEGRKIK